MNDRPTADRLPLRASAPSGVVGDFPRPTTVRPSDAPVGTPAATRPAGRPRRRLGRLIDAVGRLAPTSADQPDRPSTDPVGPVDSPAPESTNRADRATVVVDQHTDGKPTPRRRHHPARPTREIARRQDSPTQLGKGARIGLVVVAVLMAVVVAAPVALSAQDLVDWASAQTGLGLDKFWATLVFIALDAAAAVCVLLMVYCAVRGEPAGGFGLFVWVFASTSAFANYRHGTRVGAPDDAWWFFPLMSILGPALMELVLRRVRKWVQRDDNRRSRTLPSYGWRRWMPGLGSFKDTFGACRTAILLGIDTVDLSIDWYHYLCPDGSLRIVRAMRKLDITAEHLPREVDPVSGQPRLAPPPDSQSTGNGPTGDSSTDLRGQESTDHEATDRRADREPTGRQDDSDSTDRRTDGPEPTDSRRSDSQSTDGPTPTDGPKPDDATKGQHTDAAVKNAAILRAKYGRKVPPLADVRGQTKWSYDRAKNAIAAYDDRADIHAGLSAEPVQAGV
ncbi:hypothetical protein [Micromonospora sp. DT227]|uniref:hypothetical protein n=1 Tax=Micromonospora sp. DT227 TaxID=3393433 RepID=UPI003CE76ABD